jgi:glycosyltransferase involved in cell wall biosynthesis
MFLNKLLFTLSVVVMKKNSISAFFPCYNDEGTVELMVDRLRETLPKLTKDYEIIIVNDCSPDKSGEIAEELAKKYKEIRVIHHEKNRGYGGALRSGFSNATKDLVFYTDGDAQYDVRELVRLWPHRNKFDVVNGYKTKRGDGTVRKIMGRLYNFGMQMIFNLKVRDVDCDFRLMKREIFDNIELTQNTGLICTEMMRKIDDAGYTIKNVPVSHYDRVYGKSQFFRPRRIINTLSGLVKQWIELVILKKHKKNKNELRKRN